MVNSEGWRKRFRHWQYSPPVKTSAVVLLTIAAVVLTLVYFQFRGAFRPTTDLTLVTDRTGLAMDEGSKVTYNGVQIGRVGKIDERTVGEAPQAELTLEIEPKYIDLIPANVAADIKASTVFGNKYVSFSSPPNPDPRRISSSDQIRVQRVTTEFNTLFETITEISQKVDPVELNATLSAAAEALTGLGDRFGESVVEGNDILSQVNPRLPRFR
ncbi:MCE family protein, partial [Mycobacterium sp. MYCO198283]|uniref:MCE family protein n=1 Tax=Mycobacterium sp. MYCO198283 TaxID=2883505 RepID=UPI001E3E0E83